MNKCVGVIGSGSFGTTIADLISDNSDVLLYCRREEVMESINTLHKHPNFPQLSLSARLKATNNLREIAENCTLIFPIVPSKNFREMMRSLAPFLKPSHILIHGTKGLDRHKRDPRERKTSPVRDNIHTMSEVIRQESVVVRVGCLSGPNLAKEIMDGQPAATVVASKFREVRRAGRNTLRSRRFQVFGTEDITGAELAGALKNTVAIAAGMLDGLGYGRNIWALLVTRGLLEMIHIGKAMGAKVEAFLGTAGIGDLVATASSTNSRNFTVGRRLALGEKLEEIQEDMQEVAEGVYTLQIAKEIADKFDIPAPITRIIHRVVFEGFDLKKAITYLMTYRYFQDVDFL